MKKFLFVAPTLILLFTTQPAFAEKGNGSNSSWNSIGISYSDPGLTNCPELSINVNANWYRFQIYAKGESSPNFQLLNPINQQTENLTNKGIIRNNIDAPGGWNRNYCNGIIGYKVQNLSFEKLYDGDGRYVGYKSVDRMKTEFRIDGSRRISQNPLKFEKAYTTSGEFFWNKTFVFRSIPTPQQTSNPTPQQTTSANPLGLPIQTPYTPDYSVYINENRRILEEVRKSLIEEIKQTKQATCRKYELWTNLQNIEPYAQFLPGGEMCLDYEGIKYLDFSLENIQPTGSIDNELILSTSSLDPRFSDVKIEVFHTKKGSKVAKLIAKPKLQIDSRRYHYCYFDFKGTYLDQPVHIWECRMDNTFPAHYALIKIPKSVGKFASVGGENPAKIDGKFQIVLSNKNAVGKKKITYTWNEKNGWFTGGNLG